MSKKQKLHKIKCLDTNKTFYALTKNIVRYMSRSNPFKHRNVEIIQIVIPEGKCMRTECAEFIETDTNCINKRKPKICGMFKKQKKIDPEDWKDCDWDDY